MEHRPQWAEGGCGISFWSDRVLAAASFLLSHILGDDLFSLCPTRVVIISFTERDELGEANLLTCMFGRMDGCVLAGQGEQTLDFFELFVSCEHKTKFNLWKIGTKAIEIQAQNRNGNRTGKQSKTKPQILILALIL